MPLASSPLISAAPQSYRIGQGWDTHRLIPGRPLVLGGVTIPHPQGLLGHSDADVLIHAIIDALLGAAGLGDIGQHFSDTDMCWHGVDSRVLLRTTYDQVRTAGWRLGNLDATVLAQAPKLAPHLPTMRVELAACLACQPNQINLKAKTYEKLGPVGEGLSMEAQAICLLFSAGNAIPSV